MNFWSIVYVILLYNTYCAISCQQQWQKKGKTNVIYGYATISIEIQKGMLFRKKFPAIKYSLGSSSRQLPPPLSCLQCYLHYSNWRLQVRVAFLHLTSSWWISGAVVLLWVKFQVLLLGEISGAGVLLWASQGLSSSSSFSCRMRNEHRSVGKYTCTKLNLIWFLRKEKLFHFLLRNKSEGSLWAGFWWMWTCENLWWVKRPLMLCLWWSSPAFALMVERVQPKSFHLFIWAEPCKAPNPDFYVHSLYIDQTSCCIYLPAHYRIIWNLFNLWLTNLT